ncbi:hypothetical protein [Chitinophaga sp. sic0106]|uniref:hypothetical protein n=1 Tax=Chitinophaga sp. sic0106 TaxID=2854785 RepID=UPI001C445A0E|nr:hypothetical protein [Chitinophaga sp. sic0106]MBV7529893.1 hypothetical protein [Chitinophaga sp. sic0106]
MTYASFDKTGLFLPTPIPENITAGFYLPGNNIPETMSLSESWSTYKGYYFFLLTPIAASDTTALKTLQTSIADITDLQQPLHTGACWLLNNPASATVQSILQATVENDNVIVYTNLHLGFGTYQLPIFQGAPLLFTEEGGIAAGYPAVAGAQDAAPSKSLSINVIGDQAGVIIGEAMINDFSNNSYTGWAAGFRYNMPDPQTSLPSSQYYPIFNNNPETYWHMGIHWDPLHPLDPSRSYMNFTGISFGLEKITDTTDRFQIVPENNAVMESWWRTIYGQPITLQPVTTGGDPAKLVFQTYSDPVQPIAYYLAPKGTFILQAKPNDTGRCYLLPGLSGAESIQFVPGDAIIFFPGNAANAASGLSSPTLDTTYTAAYAFILAQTNAPTIYSTAPAVASLYKPSATTGLLEAWPAPAAELPATGDNALSFPLVPYAGIITVADNAFPEQYIPAFESRLLATTREAVMNRMPPPKEKSDVAETVTTTTPQGLLATINGFTWQEVLLAKNTELPVNFRFTDVPAILRSALQTEDLFLVISDTKNIGTFDNKLSIEGWQFNVNVPTRNPDAAPDLKNILILKFRKGTISSLVQQTNQWTAGVDFNYDTDQQTAISTWLSQYCQDAIEMAATNDHFAEFAKIIQDPNWYGILALQTDIDLGNFPKDLRGLLGAMDLSRFYAHHIGVQVNFVAQGNQNTGSQSLDVNRSNLFGLISYMDPTYQQNQGGDTASALASGLRLEIAQNTTDDISYAYKVLILQVIFSNTVITNFNSKLQLTARKWFEDAATLNVPGQYKENPPANYAMIFNGHYENHDGHRTYTFLTDKNLTYQYFLTSGVLNYIEFVKAQFQTTATVVNPNSPDFETVNARFSFYGYLNFNPLDKFDCFSYGGEADQPLIKQRGLYFSNLALDVGFTLNTKNNTTAGLAIVLNPDNTSFDQSMSSYRTKSFAAAFPVSPNAILRGSGDNNPKKLRYLSVVPPVDFVTGGIQSQWYAINFDLHWGGPGGLASAAGFLPQLLLSWSPGAAAVNVEIFVKLPGSGSANTFSIQNVLKLSAGPFQLTQVKGNDNISYNFYLINLSISLFGIKLPPAGNTNLVLVGDADQPGNLGWYSAYINL